MVAFMRLRNFMNKLLKFSCFVLLFHQLIFSDQHNFCAYQAADPLLFFDAIDIPHRKISEGFCTGTLVSTQQGYQPIEELQSGDCVVGLHGLQEVVAVRRFVSEKSVRLLIDGDFVIAAPHQSFYRSDKVAINACDLQVGDFLFDRRLVQEVEIVDEMLTVYALSTEEHGFFVYPHIHVHNFDFAVVGSAGLSVMIGAIEVLNPVTVLFGVMIPLSLYALEHFRSDAVYSCEFEEEDCNLPEEVICLQSDEVLQKTRDYYHLKMRALYNLYQDLVKIKNDISIFVKPNYSNKFYFSFGFLSQCRPIAYKLPSLPSLAQESQLSCANKAKLMKSRQDNLDRLEQDIFDLHLLLAFHVSELIDRRDEAEEEFLNFLVDVQREVGAIWNQNLECICDEIAFDAYRATFVQDELSLNLKQKIQELNFVTSYYDKLQNFFTEKTTNLKDVFVEQNEINADMLAWIENRIKIQVQHNYEAIESYLEGRGLLTQSLVDHFKNYAQQYSADLNKNAVLEAKRKHDNLEKQAKKEKQGDKKGGGGGGPEKDPDDEPSSIIGFFKNVLTHAFEKREGHLEDSPENRKLILDMAKKARNFLGRDSRGNNWYGDILKNGKQLWASTRDNFIRNCGLNEVPHPFDPDTGLCINILKNK